MLEQAWNLVRLAWDWILAHPFVVVVVVGLLVSLRLFKWGRRKWLLSKPARLHPRLQKYGDPQRLTAERRRAAARIRATSSTPSIMGYDIVEQIDAVYVDGFARPEDALEGLKAVAALKGANALTNVRQERAGTGRYAASGDAVRVERTDGPEATPEETSAV